MWLLDTEQQKIYGPFNDPKYTVVITPLQDWTVQVEVWDVETANMFFSVDITALSIENTIDTSKGGAHEGYVNLGVTDG